MRFPSPLQRGRLLRRYKRFLADVVLDDGREITAHTPNPGAMLGLNASGSTVWLSQSPSPTRKLPFTFEMVETPTGLVGVNTLHPNRLVAEALDAGAIPELATYPQRRPEVKYGKASRIDFLLTGEGAPPCYLEVKNCHFSREAGLAEFPDCTAARSAKHLEELVAMKAEGARAAVLFVVQRADCGDFTAAHDLDPAFAGGLERAAAAGVEVLVYGCDLSTEEIRIARRLGWRRA